MVYMYPIKQVSVVPKMLFFVSTIKYIFTSQFYIYQLSHELFFFLLFWKHMFLKSYFNYHQNIYTCQYLTYIHCFMELFFLLFSTIKYLYMSILHIFTVSWNTLLFYFFWETQVQRKHMYVSYHLEKSCVGHYYQVQQNCVKCMKDNVSCLVSVPKIVFLTVSTIKYL